MYKEYYAYGISPAITESVNTKFVPTILTLDNDSDFELHGISIFAGATRYLSRLKIYDSYNSRYITGNNPINITAIGGQALINAIHMFTSGQISSLPYMLHTPYRFKKGSNIIIESTNMSTDSAITGLQIVLHGAKIRDTDSLRKQNYEYEEFGIYTLNRGQFSSGTYTDGITIDNSCDFEVTQLLCNTAGTNVWTDRIDIMDGWNGNQWTNKNAACSLWNMTGSASMPFILPAHKFIPKSGTIVVTFTGISGVTNFAIGGIKLYE